jgi:hypothetical protein
MAQNNARGSVTIGTAGGNLSGTYPNPQVIKLDGYALATPFNLGAAQDGYVLKWHNATSNFQVLSPTGGGPQLAGDLGNTSSTPYVESITGTSPIAITPATLRWISSTSNPTITQASISTNGAANTLSITAQPNTNGGGSAIGGVLALAGGAATGGGVGGAITIIGGQAGTGSNTIITGGGVAITGGTGGTDGSSTEYAGSGGSITIVGGTGGGSLSFPDAYQDAYVNGSLQYPGGVVQFQTNGPQILPWHTNTTAASVGPVVGSSAASNTLLRIPVIAITGATTSATAYTYYITAPQGSSANQYQANVKGGMIVPAGYIIYGTWIARVPAASVSTTSTGIFQISGYTGSSPVVTNIATYNTGTTSTNAASSATGPITGPIAAAGTTNGVTITVNNATSVATTWQLLLDIVQY